MVVTIKEYVMINGEERDLDGMAEKPNEWDDFHLFRSIIQRRNWLEKVKRRMEVGSSFDGGELGGT